CCTCSCSGPGRERRSSFPCGDPSSWGPRRVTWGALLPLSGDGLLRTLTGAGIGLGALAVHRESPAVAQALVGTDLDRASDVSLDLAAQVALDLVVALDVISEDCQLLVGEVLGTQVGTDARALQDLDGPGPSDAENVRERDLHPLVAGEVDAG